MRATTVRPPDFKGLTSQADTILEGEVIDVALFWKTVDGQKLPFSNVVIKVSDTLKQPKEAKTSEGDSGSFTLKLFGGEFDGKIATIAGAPLFAKGDKALFFIVGNGDFELPLVGAGFGHYWIETDPKTGNAAVYKGDGTALLGPEEIDAISKKGSYFLNPRTARRKIVHSDKTPIPLNEFKKRIQAQLQSGS